MSPREKFPVDEELQKFNQARLANDANMQALTTAEDGQIAAMYLLAGNSSANHELAIAASSNYVTGGRTLIRHAYNKDGSITTSQTGIVTNQQGSAHVSLDITQQAPKPGNQPEIIVIQARRLNAPSSSEYAIYAGQPALRKPKR